MFRHNRELPVSRRQFTTLAGGMLSTILAGRGSNGCGSDNRTLAGLYSSLSLSDGRQLWYREFGSPGGLPIVYFHATPGSSLDVELLLHGVDTSMYRVIAMDRPGIGRSAPKQCHSISGYAADVAQLTHALGLDRYRIVGYSGGCRFALACAARLPDQVISVALVAVRAPGAPGVGAGVVDRQIYQLRRSPRIATKVLQRDARRQRRSCRLTRGFRRTVAKLAAVDQQVIYARESLMVNISRSCCAQGVQGLFTDFRLMPWPWGIDLTSIRCPVHLWSGDRDLTAPLSTVQFIERQLNHLSTTHIISGEGHVSLIYRLGNSILSEW